MKEVKNEYDVQIFWGEPLRLSNIRLALRKSSNIDLKYVFSSG